MYECMILCHIELNFFPGKDVREIIKPNGEKDMRTKSEVKSGKLMKLLSSDVINYHCNYFQKIYFLLCPHLPTSFTCKRDILFTPCLP